MLVVADSSALVALATCNSLTLLEALFREVKVPQAVYDEVAVEGKPHADKLMAWLRERVAHVDPVDMPTSVSGLGRGEVEAMALYLKLNADYLLIDDRIARAFATSNNISVIGSLGVLVSAKQKGIIASIREPIDLLRDSDIRVSGALLTEALRLTNE